MIDEHISKVILDKINVLYVALTRAENHLYVISEYNSLKKESDTPNTYSQLFIDYLKKSTGGERDNYSMNLEAL